MKCLFKSYPRYWKKERDGRKPNTFRKFKEGDTRFTVRPGDTITMQNTETGETFTRTLTDLSYYEGWMIFSWRHEDE